MISYITPSMLQDYLLCPNNYYYKHVLKIPYPTTGFAWLGTKVHEAIALTIQQKQDTAFCLQTFESNFVNLRNYKDEEMVVDWREEDPEKLRKQGRGLIELYTQHPDYLAMDVLETEKPYTFHLKPSPDLTTFIPCDRLEPENMTISCRLDAILANHQILDFKTSSRRYLDADVKAKLQFDLYAIAYYLNQPESFRSLLENETVSLRCDVLIKTIEPKIQILTLTKTSKDRERVLQNVYRICRAIEAELFYPTPNILCANYCSFKPLCQGDTTKSVPKGIA